MRHAPGSTGFAPGARAPSAHSPLGARWNVIRAGSGALLQALRCQILDESADSPAVWRLDPGKNSSLPFAKHFFDGPLVSFPLWADRFDRGRSHSATLHLSRYSISIGSAVRRSMAAIQNSLTETRPASQATAPLRESRATRTPRLSSGMTAPFEVLIIHPL